MEKNEDTKAGKTIRVKWGSAVNLPALYVSHLYVSHGGKQEFYLIFGNLTPPVGFSEQGIPDELEITPISKLVISPDTMKSFVKAMSDNLKIFEEKYIKISEEK